MDFDEFDEWEDAVEIGSFFNEMMEEESEEEDEKKRTKKEKEMLETDEPEKEYDDEDY